MLAMICMFYVIRLLIRGAKINIFFKELSLEFIIFAPDLTNSHYYGNFQTQSA